MCYPFGMKILICEDEEILLTALEFRLRKLGYEVVLAKDGQEALQLIPQHKPDLIIADVQMPHVTGLELIEKVRTGMQSDLPIIVISALEHDEFVLEALKLGANDFVTKPFKPAELVLRVQRVFQQFAKTG